MMKTIVMDMIKKEPEVDPLAIQSSDNSDTDEKKPLSEEGNLLDLHVAGMKTEYVYHSYDLISEFEVEEIGVRTNFVTTKCKTEEELCDLHTVKDELKLEFTAEENEILTNSVTDIHDGQSSGWKDFAQEDHTTVDEAGRYSVSTENSMRPHGSKNRFKCDVCGRFFSHSGSLIIHKRVHTGEKPFKCNVCGKCFSQSGSLTYHQRRHTGEKPLKCHECEKCFSHRSQLKKHELLHTGEKPFMCQVCGRSFADASNLISHSRLHKGERQFKCDVCGKCFLRSNELKRHRRQHTGVKPFKCKVCEKTFSDSGNLKSHERIHSGEKPFKCSVCGKGFTQQSTMKRHEKSFKCVVESASVYLP